MRRISPCLKIVVITWSQQGAAHETGATAVGPPAISEQCKQLWAPIYWYVLEWSSAISIRRWWPNAIDFAGSRSEIYVNLARVRYLQFREHLTPLQKLGGTTFLPGFTLSNRIWWALKGHPVPHGRSEEKPAQLGESLWIALCFCPRKIYLPFLCRLSEQSLLKLCLCSVFLPSACEVNPNRSFGIKSTYVARSAEVPVARSSRLFNLWDKMSKLDKMFPLRITVAIVCISRSKGLDVTFNRRTCL
jgi:hypothetical protein